MDKLSSDCTLHLATELMENIHSMDRTRNLVKHRTRFTGKQVVDWIVQSQVASNRVEAMQHGEVLCKMGFVKPVGQNHNFRDTCALYRFNELQVVNAASKRTGLALVADDIKESVLLNWVRENREKLSRHTLYATGTAQSLSFPKPQDSRLDFSKVVHFGEDPQVGALIAEKSIETLIFFWILSLHNRTIAMSRLG